MLAISRCWFLLVSAFVFTGAAHDFQDDLAFSDKNLVARQGPAVVSSSSFLRRSFTACEFSLEIASLVPPNRISQPLWPVRGSILMVANIRMK